MSEEAIHGWVAIAQMFGCSERKMRRLKDELLNSGVIFYLTMGKPPRKTVCAFPSKLRNWAGRKGAAGEVI